MARKISKLLMMLIVFCLCMSTFNIKTTQATEQYRGEFGVIKIDEVQGTTVDSSSETTGSKKSDRSWFITRNTGIRLILEYTENVDDSINSRKEVGGKNSSKYYFNIIKDYNDDDEVKLFIGSNSTNSNVSIEYMSDSEIKLYDFANREIVYNQTIGLEDIVKGNETICEFLSSSPKDYGELFIDWKNDSPDELYLTDWGIKLLTSIMASRAAEQNDKTVIEELRNIYNLNFGHIYVKAEIIFDTEEYIVPAGKSSSKGYSNGYWDTELPDWLSYLELREYSLTKNGSYKSLRTGGYDGGSYNYGGKLDFIACKLYEDNELFSLTADGHVNCSCNFIEQHDYKENGKLKFTFDSEEEIFHLRKDDDTENGVLNQNIRDDAHAFAHTVLPNICSIEIDDGKYTSLLKNPQIEYLGYYKGSTGKLVWGTHTLGNYLLGTRVAQVAKNKSIKDAILPYIYDDKPTIFEGWDYIEIKGLYGEAEVKEILVKADGTEVELDKYVDEGINFGIQKQYSRKEFEKNDTSIEYDYYVIKNNVTDISTTKQYGNIATVEITKENKDYTITFYYKEVTASARVQEILLMGNRTWNVLCSSTYENLELNKEKEFVASGDKDNIFDLKYVGNYVEEGLISTVDYTSIDNFETEKSVTITPTKEKRKYIITFVYELDVYGLGIPVEFLHYNNNTGMYLGETTKKTYRDISDLFKELYQNADSDTLSNAQKEYNGFVIDETKTLKNKLVGIFGLFNTDGVWNNNNIENVKTLNINHPEISGLQFVASIEEHEYASVPVRIANKSDIQNLTRDEILALSQIGATEVDSVNKQYVVNMGHMIQTIELSEDIELNKPLSIIYLYDNNKRNVSIKHRDIITGGQVTYADGSSADEYKSVTNGSTLIPAPTAINGIDYTYIGYVKNNESMVYGAGNLPVQLVNITEDVNIVFYYQRNPDIVGNIIPEDENIQLEPDPDDPDPINPNDPNYAETHQEEKILVLDDEFTLNINVADAISGDQVKVKFPFDVYDLNKTPNKFVEANTVLSVGKLEATSGYATSNYAIKFRLPSWIIEQTYNTPVVIYLERNGAEIVRKEIKITVIGRLYDFTVTNLEKDTAWNTSLFKGQNQNKEYKAAELPIGQASQQSPVYTSGIKLGSTFLYSINTKGLKSDKIQIDSKVIYVKKDGTIVDDATLYYKVANQADKNFTDAHIVNNNNFSTMLSKTIRVTQEVRAEIVKGLEFQKLGDYIKSDTKKNYASVKNAYKEFTPTVTRTFGNYNTMVLPNTLRTPFVNYITQEAVNIYNNNYKNNAINVNMTEDEIINSVGHWYGEYKLPGSLYAKDSSGNRLPDDGYFIVLFNIKSLYENNKPYLSYTLPANNTQWMKENADLYNTNNIITIELPKLVGQTSAISINLNLNSNKYKGYYPVAVYEAGPNNDQEVAITH